MGIFEIVILSVIGVFALFGFIGGIKKGLARAILRLIVIAAAVFAAFFFKDKLTEIVCNITINGAPLKDLLLDAVCTGDLASMKDSVWPIFKIIISCLIFIVGLLLELLIAVPIVHGIIRLIFIHGEKHLRFVGGIIGLLYGLAIGLIFANVIAGLGTNVDKLAYADINGQSLVEYIGVQDTYASIGIAEFNESKEAPYLSMLNPVVYEKVATTTIEDKSYTLDAQVDAFTVTLKIASKLQAMENLDTSNTANLASMLRDIDTDFANLSEEAKEVINTLISSAADSFGLDIGDVDATKLDFGEAADLVEMMDSENFDTSVAIDKAVSSGVANLLVSANVVLGLDSSEKAEAEALIDSKDLSSEEKEVLRKLFGLA